MQECTLAAAPHGAPAGTLYPLAQVFIFTGIERTVAEGAGLPLEVAGKIGAVFC